MIAYIFSFFPQRENLAYVHLIGVREKHQNRGLGKMLLGMTMIGEPNEDRINVIKNYSGINNDKVVFIKNID